MTTTKQESVTGVHSSTTSGWAAVLFERSLDGIVLYSPNGTILDANPAAEQLAAVDKRHWVGRSIAELEVIHPGDRDDVLDRIRQCGDGRTFGAWELILHRADGTAVVVESSMFPFQTPDQTLVVAILRDITDRSRAFEELKESTRRLQLAQEVGEMGDWSYDLATNELHWSRGTYRLFGMKPDAEPLLTSNLSDGMTPASAQLHLEAFNRVADTGVGEEIELITRPVSGTSRLLRSVIRAVGDDQGKVVRLFGTLQDITQYSVVKQELERSEVTLRAALAVSPVAIYVQDKNLVFTHVINPLSGRPESDFLGHDESIHPIEEERRELTAIKRRVLETGEPWRGDLKFTAQGSLRVVDFTAGPQRDGTGAVIGVISSSIDITERRKLEDSLRRENEILENVTQSMGAGVAVISREFKTLWANQLLKRMYGEVEGLTCHWAYNRRSNICPGCGVIQVFRSGKEQVITEQRGTGADGSDIWVQLVVTPIRDKKGEIVAAVEVVVPITDRKKSEEALRLSEVKYRGLFETVPDGIVLVDIDGRILESNLAYQKMVGYTDEELRRISYADITPSKWHEWEAGIVKNQILGRGYSDAYVKEYIHKDGTKFPISVRGALIRDQGGRPMLMWGIVRDISEQVKQEAELRRLATAVGQAADAIVITDNEGRIQYVNPAFEQITGYIASEVVGLNPRVLKSGRHSDDFYRELWTTIAGDRTWHGRLVNRRKDGSEYAEEMSITPVRDDSGNCTNYVAIKRDISDRIALEARLSEEDVRRRILVEQSNDGIVVLDESGAVLETNWRFAEMLGYTTDEIRGFHVWDWDTRFTREELVEMLSRMGEEGVRLETSMKRIDESLIEVEISANSALIDGRKLIFTVCRDISDRLKAAESLRQSEERYRTVAEHTHNWEYWTSPDGRLEYCSPSCERLTGYSREEFIANPSLLRDIIHSEDRAMWQEHREDNAAGIGLTDFRIVTKSGDVRWIAHVCTLVYGGDGRWLGRRASNQDITDRKAMIDANLQLERQFFQSQKMEAVGRLAGGVAHDFNNLLTVITGYSELLLKRLDPNTIMKGDVEEIHKAAARASGLTRQLLAFSRRQVTQPQRIDVDKLVTEMSKMLHRLIGEDIEYHLQNADKPLIILADPAQIEQVVMNLTINARDAMPKGGLLNIRLGSARHEKRMQMGKFTLEPGEYILLEVEDTGVGMPPETLAHMFEPFFTTKEIGKGTGLGLATVYGIVEHLHGAIDILSRVDHGTTFAIYLPQASAEQSNHDGVSPTSDSRAAGLEILLVEDEPAVRELIKRMLIESGHSVRVCENAFDALNYMLDVNERIDLLLSDVVMPRIDGGRLAEQARVIRPEIKIILMSGYTDKMLSEESLSAVRASFIMKPFSQEELSAKIAMTVYDGKNA